MGEAIAVVVQLDGDLVALFPSEVVGRSGTLSRDRGRFAGPRLFISMTSTVHLVVSSRTTVFHLDESSLPPRVTAVFLSRLGLVLTVLAFRGVL
jgi:hypothetical protein